MESAALIDACSNFVVQLDEHQVGAAIFFGIIALAAVSVAVVALAMTQRAGGRRGRHVDKGSQIDSSQTRPEQQ